MKKLFAFALGLAVILTACNDGGDDDPRYLTLDFETGTAAYLAGPTSYGDNLYSAYVDGEYDGYDADFPRYTGYHDTKTDLQMSLNMDEGSSEWNTNDYEFYSGGIAISQYNDMAGDTYKNQCSVYGTGGHSGSKTFGVVSLAGPVSIGFKTSSTERKFEEIWVNNTTYGVLVMKNGNSFTGGVPLADNDGWLLLTIEGFNVSGTSTGNVKFYLADFRTANSPGIVTDWTRVDLTSLGKVHKLAFTIDGSDKSGGWLNTPAYFCFDNLTFSY